MDFKKSSLFLLAFVSSTSHQNTHTVSLDNAIKTSTVIVTSYFVGRGCAYLYHSWVKNEYQEEFDLLNSSLYAPGSKELRDELFNIILSKHNRAYGWFSDPGHYPFIRYGGRLDSYITKLSIFRYFYFDDQTKSEFDCMRSLLQEIREYLVQDYRYIQERRQFAESLQ